MHIAQGASLHIAVPPHDYGGSERVIGELTERLVALGHDVMLFASGDSRTSARLVPFVPHALGFDSDRDAVALHLTMLSEVYRQAEVFDVIHSHLEHLTLPFSLLARSPTILTLHGRLDIPDVIRLMLAYPTAHYISSSNAQRRPVPDVGWAATIYHGVDVASVPFASQPGDYLLFVGRMCEEKRPDRAIEIALRAGVPLKIAAKSNPKDRAYFKQVVEPKLHHPLVHFLGPVSETRKRELMSHALALLLPIDWPEPFGLVFIEALACGTPVLTCPQGAAPEILEDGVTGYLRESDEELVSAVRNGYAISQTACRQHAMARFDTTRMAREYVEVYKQAQCIYPPRVGVL